MVLIFDEESDGSEKRGWLYGGKLVFHVFDGFNEFSGFNEFNGNFEMVEMEVGEVVGT